MKKMAAIAATAIVLGSAAPALAGGGYPSRVAEKLAFGVGNIVYSPVDLLTTPICYAVDFDHNVRLGLPGFFVGIPAGIGHAVGRFTVGVGDLLSAPFASPGRPPRKWHWLPMTGPFVLSPEPESVDGAR
jgi:hypothetical protein